MLKGFVSLEPAEGGASEASLDAPIEIVLSTYEQLLEKLGEDLRAEGNGTKNVAEALRPKYVDLAVLRAAVGGRQLLLHVPSGEAAKEQSFTTLIGARLAGLQKARDLDLLGVRIASSMPARGDDQPWAAKLLDGKGWHLSSEASLDAAWNRGKSSQAIPRLTEDGFSATDARTLYDLGVRTMTGVTRAIRYRRFLPGLPADVIARDMALPALSDDDWSLAMEMRFFYRSGDEKILKALRDGTLVWLREVRLDMAGHFASVYTDLISLAYGDWFKPVEGDPVSLLLSSLRESLGKSLPHLLPEHDEAVASVASNLMQALTGMHPWEGGAAPLSDAILTLQWLQFHTGRPLPVSETTPWMPERLRGVVSFVDVDATKRKRISPPTAIVLQAFEDLLEKVQTRLDEQGTRTERATNAIESHFLRLAVMRAAATGQSLLLHVPRTRSAQDRLRMARIEAALHEWERARKAGLVDVAVASSNLPVDQKLAWSARTSNRDTLHVASDQPLEEAWLEGQRGHAVHRMAMAGYSDDDALALLAGGINTPELADRAIQLRQFFGNLSTEVVLKDVLEKPAFGLRERELVDNLRWLSKAHPLDALGFVRGDEENLPRMYRVCCDVPGIAEGALFPGRSRLTVQENVRAWLTETQGPGATLDDAAITEISIAVVAAVNVDIDPLGTAFLIAEKLRLLHHGQATVADPGDWIPEFMRRDVKVVPVDKVGGAPTMAASDYVVLRAFMRAIDELHASHEQAAGRAEADRMTMGYYLQLQALRAAATGQTLELRMPARHSGRDADEVAVELSSLPGMIDRFRTASGKLETAGLKIGFLPAISGDANGDTPVTKLQEVEFDGQDAQPVKRAKRAAEEARPDLLRGDDSQRQAALLMQDIAGQTAPGEASFPAVRTMPSPMTLLTGQTA